MHTRLRRLAKHWEFADDEFESKCKLCKGTARLRKKALEESNYSRKDMLIDDRSAQASGMEGKFKDEQLNEVERKHADT